MAIIMCSYIARYSWLVGSDTIIFNTSSYQYWCYYGDIVLQWLCWKCPTQTNSYFFLIAFFNVADIVVNTVNHTWIVWRKLVSTLSTLYSGTHSKPWSNIHLKPWAFYWGNKESQQAVFTSLFCVPLYARDLHFEVLSEQHWQDRQVNW